MPKMPSTLYDPAYIESSLLNAATRISKKTSAKFPSIHSNSFLIEDLSEEMRRSSFLLSMAKKGKDDTSQTEEVATQALLEWTNTVDAIRRAEKTLKNLVSIWRESNDKLFEKVTSRDD